MFKTLKCALGFHDWSTWQTCDPHYLKRICLRCGADTYCETSDF